MLHSDDTLTLGGGKLIEAVCDLSILDSEGIVQRTKNVYHFYRVTAFTYDAADICQQAHTAIQTAVLGAVNSSCTATLTTVRDLSNPNDAGASVADAAVGSNGGDRLPSSAAVVINLKTGLRGKNYRGSKHYVGCSETMTTKDELNGSGTAPFSGIASMLSAVPVFTDSSGNQWLHCVLSTSLSRLNANPVVVTYADVTACTVNLTLGTMRKRKEPTRVL